MDLNAYRQKIEASVAKAQTRSLRTLRHGSTAAGPRALVANKTLSAKRRAEALGQATGAEERDAVPQLAIDRLADAGESAVVRRQAIKLLQQKQIFSPSAPEWRPAFVEALRAAVEKPTVRAAALEVLALLKDRQTQELLLQGLRHPKKALVPADEALRLLSTDIHAGVIDAARKLITTPQIRRNKNAAVQATRILGADPKSLDTLERVLGSDAYALDVRKAAATAISHLSPERLGTAIVAKVPAKRGANAVPAKRRTKAKTATAAKGRRTAKQPGALAAHIATLQRVRE